MIIDSRGQVDVMAAADIVPRVIHVGSLLNKVLGQDHHSQKSQQFQRHLEFQSQVDIQVSTPSKFP
jgi:hypothetical protein